MELEPTHHNDIGEAPLAIATLAVKRVENEARAALRIRRVYLAARRRSDDLLSEVEALNLANAGLVAQEGNPETAPKPQPVNPELSDRIWSFWLDYAKEAKNLSEERRKRKPKQLANTEAALEHIFQGQEGLFYSKCKSIVDACEAHDEAEDKRIVRSRPVRDYGIVRL